MALIVDTHAILWLATGHKRLSYAFVEALGRSDNYFFISAITAWEYTDLQLRGRLGNAPRLSTVIEDFGCHLLDFPADLWQFAADLPNIHRDPIDRMLIAHAIALDLTLVTADKAIHSYPVKTLW